ncbi:hypothetical protein N9Y96_02805 [Gammaproteobacteria bacterium]|nr:hypothetical protein [Gammaproteobacteria bacterium]MDB9841469.1 hypothetical protein [Gammaproteobacteria bacterium]
MKSRKNTVITLIGFIAILASCTSAKINHSNQNFILEESLQAKDVKQYFSYKDFSAKTISELNLYIKDSQLSSDELNNLKKLLSNIRKIASKEDFIIYTGKSNIYSFELIQLIYGLDLPIQIKWDQSDKKYISQNVLSEAPLGFCSSLYEDALETIATEVSSSSDSALLVYSEGFSDEKNFLTDQFPKINSILFKKGDPQLFAAETLGINSSNKRFKKITSLNPNQKLEFSARPRHDVQKIFLLLEPAQFQSVFPAFMYHGGNKFQYVNFISNLEALNNTNQLLDFENSSVTLSERLSQHIRSKEITSLEGIMQRSMLHDWLLIEIIKQAGIRSADIDGMTGTLKFQRNSCTTRSLPMQRINSNWINS